MYEKLYLVYGDTWFGCYGSEINIFGVFTSKEMAEKVKKQKEDEYFENDQKSKFTEVAFYIKEICVNTICNEYLGGYIE